jgi:nicotinamidase-related amidase
MGCNDPRIIYVSGDRNVNIKRRDIVIRLFGIAAMFAGRFARAEAKVAGSASRRVALLALDLQRDFLAIDGRLPVAADQAAALLVAANRLLSAAPEMDWLPVVIFNSYSPWNVQNPFRHFAALRNSPGAEMDARLNIEGLPRFAKSEPDAFSNPGLGRFLAQQAIERVAIVGVFTEACVSATARGARARGFNPIVVSDAVASGDSPTRDKALKNLQSQGIEVMTSEELLRT